MRMSHWMWVAALLAAAPAYAAEATKEPPARSGSAGSGLSNLKSYEERRYRIDMMDCAKEKGADRSVCERAVHRKAERKSRRRGAN